MKKFLQKFIIILILISISLEIVLPKNAYSSEDQKWMSKEEFLKSEYANDYKKGQVSKSGRYVYGSGRYNSSSNINRKTTNVLYESGEDIYIVKYLITQTGGKLDGYYLEAGKTYYILKDDSLFIQNQEKLTFSDKLKNMIARFMYTIANGLHYLVGVAIGDTVTIDDLVFNNYSEINISFFEDKAKVNNPSSLLYGTDKVGGLNSVVNKWYSIFIKISLMGYMVILVYMGVKILLTSTADGKANYKKLFVDWIIGLAILFLFPYVMKYMIKINESFVEVIEANKGYEDRGTSALKNKDFAEKENLINVDIDETIDWLSGNDYMSTIASRAYYTAEPALSLAFLIMTWQLIALLFHYFKRLFMIAFLIIIFPLVGLFYALDKIADGKSQAFNTWAKEFMVNVFVQTFHAIVYVFCCSTVYSASGTTDATGYDFILVIVGVTFLFNGEAIIRQIFGQVSTADTMKSLSDSAAATFAKLTVSASVVKAAGDYTVGKKSIANKLVRGTREIGAINARLRAYDKTATTPEDYNIGARLEHAPKDPGEGATDVEKKNFLKERALFNAAAIFNNPRSHSKAEQAKALNELKKEAKRNPNHDVFKDTKATAGQIAALADLDYDVEKMVNSGVKRLDIEREVTARIGIIFPGEEVEKTEDRVGTYFSALYLEGSNDTVSKNRIRRDIKEIIRETKDINDSIVFDDGTASKGDVNEEIYNDTEDILDNYDSDIINDNDDIEIYVANLAILKKRGTGNFSEDELLDAADYIRNHQGDSDLTAEMLEDELGMDADMFMHALAKKVAEDSSSDETKERAQRIVEDYENDARKDYYDDEISVHEIMKEMNNNEELDRIIEELYQNKKDAMKETTEDLAKEYLIENQIDIMEGSYDTTLRTQDGYTEEELLAMKVDAIGQTLSNLAAVNKESAEEGSGGAGLLGWIMKEYLAKKEEERAGITMSMQERKDLKDILTTTQDYIEKNKKERERIQNEHFLGDIDKK